MNLTDTELNQCRAQIQTAFSINFKQKLRQGPLKSCDIKQKLRQQKLKKNILVESEQSELVELKGLHFYEYSICQLKEYLFLLQIKRITKEREAS